RDFDREELLGLIASVEARSEHPVARAIVDDARRNEIVLSPVTEFESVPGFGVEGQVAGHLVQIGADRFMNQFGIDTSSFRVESLRLAEEGKTPLYAAVDGRLAAMLAVSDPIKESTPAAIKALHRLGLRVAMITGD
ncbi:HAD family hydrolase, partial [Bradyrhizobium sp. NBAIM08]|uniref:HAD family hydrolase n=1 Tax=Bradyrhizobium sp. NBAIM08 TaxID=2793815 RepID=UPI001CD706C6